MKKERFSFSAEEIEEPEDARDPRVVGQALSGTYRTNWPMLKHSAQSGAFACLVNMDSHLLPVANRIVEKNAQAGERAFMLALNHQNLVGGLALGTVVLVAFAQESFARIAYQVSEELRIRRNRSRRAENIDEAILKTVSFFESQHFTKRCEILLKAVEVSPGKRLQPSVDLMTFRNQIAHDSAQLNLKDGRRVTVYKGSQRNRQERVGRFASLESQSCPVRLQHVKAAIDAHDQLVTLCLESRRQEWVEAMNEFDAGIGLRIRDVFQQQRWYEALEKSANMWEKLYQGQTDAPLESIIEMRNAMKRRAAIKSSN